jgi:hypothetical protein
VGRVRTTEQFTGTPFDVSINNINPKLYELPIDFKVIDYDTYELNYIIGGFNQKKAGKFNQPLVDVDFNFIINRDKSFSRNSEEVLSKLDYQIKVHEMNALVTTYQTALKVENPDYTNVLVLTMEDIIPERAILILDTLSKVYINKSVNSRFDINERTISFINKQLDDVRASLKEIEDTMQNYKKQKAILDLDWEREDFFNKLARI